MGWLPLLTVLFCISYGLMTLLIVEQGRTIESQRALIGELFRDSMALNHLRMKSVEEQREAKDSQTRKPESPAMQAPARNSTPSSQAVPQSRVRNQKEVPRQLDPPRPAADQAQDRRALVRI